jgi:hypothetical protein
MSQGISRSKVVYIGGVEHSGSTLLGLILDNHPKIVCVGELSHLPRAGWLGADKCSCGQLVRDCTFWREVRHKWEKETNTGIDALVQLESKIDLNRRLPLTLMRQFRQSSSFAIYRDYTLTLFNAIEQVSGCNIIVDTSKRASRALALSMIDDIDFRLIHLIRDARGVAYSSGKPQRSKLVPWWYSAIRWNLINMVFDYVRKQIGEEQGMLMWYEQLISKPQETLIRLSKVIDVDMQGLAMSIVNNEGLVANHIAGGNRFLQSQTPFMLKSDIHWPEDLPSRIQRGVWMMTRYGMLRYGYTNHQPSIKS